MTYDELYSQSEEYIKSLLQKMLPRNCKYFVFGSRADGTADKSSDIDIGVTGDPVDEKTLSRIQETLEESFVPFKVDIIDFSKVDETFRAKAMRKIIPWN